MATAMECPAVEQEENPNQNCLDGMKCPNCGHFGPFDIYVTSSGYTRVTDDGTDEIEGSVEWEDSSSCRCPECRHEATVGDFLGKPKPEFDKIQKVVVEHYCNGDHPIHEVADIKDCGDGLLEFLMRELSLQEDCTDYPTASYRLNTCINQLMDLKQEFDSLNSAPGEENVLDPEVSVRTLAKPEEWAVWNISQNLTDRWGEINYHNASIKPLSVLENDSALLERLQKQMWDEITFVVRKDGKFGILFEAEFCSIESESTEDHPADESEYNPHLVVVKALLEGIAKLATEYPMVEFCIPHESQIINDRPAVWAFVADGVLSEEQRAALGSALLAL